MDTPSAPQRQPENTPRSNWRIVLDGIADDVRIVMPALRDSLLSFATRRKGPPIADFDGLADALVAEAQHVAQSSVYAYCRARTGFMAPKLFDEKEFLASLDVTRWEAFAACLADFAIIVEGQLRDALPEDNGARRNLFVQLYRNGLARYPAPEHRDGWDDAIERFDQRIAWAVENAPRPADDVAGAAGQVVYDHLPVHPDMRRFDEEMVVNSVRFRMCRAAEDFPRRIDFPVLTASLSAN